MLRDSKQGPFVTLGYLHDNVTTAAAAASNVKERGVDVFINVRISVSILNNLVLCPNYYALFYDNQSRIHTR